MSRRHLSNTPLLLICCLAVLVVCLLPGMGLASEKAAQGGLRFMLDRLATTGGPMPMIWAENMQKNSCPG